MCAPLKVSLVDLWSSLRSKRFRKVSRTFEAFFALLAPIFARPKSEKCLERAGNLTETLATQSTVRESGICPTVCSACVLLPFIFTIMACAE